MLKRNNNKINVYFLLSGADRFGELANQIFLLKRLYPKEHDYQITVISEPIDHMQKVNSDLYNVVMRGINLIYIPKELFVKIVRISPKPNFPYIIKDASNEYPFVKSVFTFLYYKKKLHITNQPLTLTTLEKETGEQLRKSYGIPENAPIVTLHVREKGFLKLFGYHDYRNASIDNYFPAINYLIQKGYYIVRIGDRSMTRINNLPKQFIDLHFQNDYKPLADIYFISQSSFTIATGSGPVLVAKAFGIPTLLTNTYFSFNAGGYDPSLTLNLYKKIFSKQLNRNLSYEEILFSPIYGFSKQDNFSNADIELIENSSEEILRATKEIIARLKGKYPLNKDKEINKRLLSIHEKVCSFYSRQPYTVLYSDKAQTIPFKFTAFYSNFQISAEYIKLNPDFLGHFYPEPSFKQLESDDENWENTPPLNDLEKAENLYLAGNTSEAEKIFLLALKTDPSSKVAYNNLGVIAFHKKEYQTGIDFFQKSINIDPFYKNAILNFFNCIKYTKQYQLIIPVLKTYLAKYPLDQDALKIYDNVMEFIEIVPSIHYKELRQCNSDTKEVLLQLNHYVKRYNPVGYRINKPHRNVILTELPGSGMKYFSHILNVFDNVISFDDRIDNIDLLPDMFYSLRKNILSFPNNSLCGTVDINVSSHSRFKAVLPELSKKVDEDVVIALNQNITYYKLNELNGMRRDEMNTLINNFGYRIIALIRDPVSTIIHWNQSDCYSLPEANVTENVRSPRWHGICFESLNKYDRQAQIWQYYASTFLALRSMKGNEKHWNELIEVIKIYTFEQLYSKINFVLNDLSNFLSIPYIKATPPSLQMDLCRNHEDIDMIRASVEKFCPARLEFGYDVSSNNEIPGFWNEKPDISIRSIEYQDYL